MFAPFYPPFHGNRNAKFVCAMTLINPKGEIEFSTKGECLGEIAKKIGAGRQTKEDKIDYGVGLVLSKKVGDFVLENEELVNIYVDEKDIALQELLNCFSINQDKIQNQDLILEVLS